VGSQHPCEIFPPKQNQGRNIIKMRKIRPKADFYLNISPKAKYITSAKRIYHFAKQNITRAKREYHCDRREPRGVTERNTSLQSGSVDSVQNSEAELQNFEALCSELTLALVRDSVQIRRFSAGKWRRKPTSRICSLPKASIRASA